MATIFNPYDGNLVLIPDATIPSGSITNAQLADEAQATIKGRASGAGTGAPQDLTATQATAILNTFTTSLQGLVPASGGGTTNFLRADGTFAAPSGAGDVVGPASATSTAIALFNGTTGKLIQNSAITVSSQFFIMTTASSQFIQTSNRTGSSSQSLTLNTGTTNLSNNTGAIVVQSGTAVNGLSGVAQLGSGTASGSGTSGDVTVSSGAVSGAGASGGISLITGAASSIANRGSLTVDVKQMLLTNTRFVTTQTTPPAVAVNANAGTGASVSLGTGSTDVAGQIIFTTGSVVGLASGTQLSLTYNLAFTNGSYIALTPNEANAAAASIVISISSIETKFNINAAIALTASTTYVWHYHVIGR